MRPARRAPGGVAVIALAAAATAAADPLAGGPELLASAERAAAVVVGRFESPAAIDRSGYGARLRVERSLSGGLQAGEIARVGWEELGGRGGSRFADGERALLALDPLPSLSLWRKRFPDGGFAIGDSGAAFLRAPDSRSVELLGRYLALPRGARSGRPGVTALARLAEDGHENLAEQAVARLAEVPGLAGDLSGEAADALSSALRDAARPESLRRELLRLATRRRLVALRPAIAPLARPGNALEAPALAALASLDGGIPPDRARALLESDAGAVRLVALTWAPETISDDALARLLVSDPDPGVRAASVASLLRRRGLAALGDATPALFDVDGGVRREAALQVAALGPDVVPELEALFAGRRAGDLTGVVAALRLCGSPGVSALRRVAAENPDEDVRAMAQMALGRTPAH